MLLSEQMKQDYIKKGNYKYLDYKVLSATIDTSSLERTSKGIIWNPATVNKGKVCPYVVTLRDKQGHEFSLNGKLEIVDIVETKQKNPSLVLRDKDTNVVAGLDLEIQTSSFLNSEPNVMSKVLGCTVEKQKQRESLIHCAIPTIHNYEPIYPTLYMIVSNKSIYVGITYRNLNDRIYEHCTLTKDKTVKKDKSTFDMIAYENAQVYCIGEFTDYTIEQINSMSEVDKDTYFHKMEQLETIMITLAQKEFPHLDLVNRKQIINGDNELKAKVLELPHDLSFNVDWECWDSLHEVNEINRYSEPMENVARYVYSLVHGVELSDSLLSLYETVGVNVRDLSHMVNNVTKPSPRTFGAKRIDYYNPTEMPKGGKDRFDGYFGYRYNPNPTYKKNKPYFKKDMFGWDNKSTKDMEEMIQDHLDKLNQQKRLYQATISSRDGMFTIVPMHKGEATKEVLFEQYLEEYHDKPITVYVKVSRPRVKPIVPTTEPKLKSIDSFINWEEESEHEKKAKEEYMERERKIKAMQERVRANWSRIK